MCVFFLDHFMQLSRKFMTITMTWYTVIIVAFPPTSASQAI